MKTFVDTSAIIAVFDADDRTHAKASLVWKQLLESGRQLYTTNYVVLEAVALLQRRYGKTAVRRFVGDVIPALNVYFVTADIHRTALAAVLLAESKKSPSMVDCASFEVIRELGIDAVFAYDRHFEAMGYTMASSHG